MQVLQGEQKLACQNWEKGKLATERGQSSGADLDQKAERLNRNFYLISEIKNHLEAAATDSRMGQTIVTIPAMLPYQEILRTNKANGGES